MSDRVAALANAASAAAATATAASATAAAAAHHHHQHRHSRISPVPARGSLVGYSACPVSDPDSLSCTLRLSFGGTVIGGGGGGDSGSGSGHNVLAIPMSAIQAAGPNPLQKASASQSRAMSLSGSAGGGAGGAGAGGQYGLNNNPPMSLKLLQSQVPEPRCGPLSGGAGLQSLSASDVDAPQPLVDRRPSVSLLKWPHSSGKSRPDATQPAYAARQVNFGAGGNGNGYGGRSEPLSLATMERDCFIIPAHSLDRFLPAGIPLPPPVDPNDNAKALHSPTAISPVATGQGPLSVLEVADPKVCILAHLMSPLEPIEPILESPLAHPLLKQRSIAGELLNEVQQANSATGAMLLANMERTAEFPFIAYYVLNTTQTDPNQFYTTMRNSSLTKFEPKNLRYSAAHTLDLYSEVAAIVRPPLVLAQNDVGHFKRTHTPSTAYIISIFKVFEGDDGERFEKNWLYWTGARMLYRYLPRSAGMRRISLHKSVSTKGDKMYLLVCECADLLKDISAAAVLIPALRARLCGYTGLYRPIQAF